jgi:hypothetical protein
MCGTKTLLAEADANEVNIKQTRTKRFRRVKVKVVEVVMIVLLDGCDCCKSVTTQPDRFIPLLALSRNL